MTVQIIETNLNFKSNHSIRNGKVTGIVLHHAAANGSVEDVHRCHLNNGWSGIGYHFYVRKNGKVYRGRPENWFGGHTVGHNEKIGICAEGNFEVETMCEAQKNALAELITYLYGKYGKVTVYRHRDLDSTACPGKNYPFNEIVSGKTSKGESTVKITLNVLKEGSKGEQVKALQMLLIGRGEKLPEYGADGSFGDETGDALESFQRKNKLTVDRICGIESWTALIKG
jgi:N-acetyl-anhydromuramyl-L-alanine amidase AmpD